MKYIKLITLVLLIVLSMSAVAQDGKASQFKNSLNISESEYVSESWLRHINGMQNRKVAVYRVQVYSGQGQDAKQKASNVKSRCVALLPDIPSFIEWESPYFKVSVGNFKSRSEATKAKEKLNRDFPGAFLVSSRVSPKSLELDE
ncbi:MAG: SPOR domain-containing protein [Bacteroidales bacterium]